MLGTPVVLDLLFYMLGIPVVLDLLFYKLGVTYLWPHDNRSLSTR